jgi:predicted  nucleic acid-binding Zn-ribbon protein
MEKTKIYMVIAPVLVSVICIILAVNVAIAGSQLQVEKAKVSGLNVRIEEMGAQLADANKRARTAQDLQVSLQAARAEIDAAKQQIASLVTENSDLMSRLDAAVNVLKAPSAADLAPAEEITEQSAQ